MSSYNVNIPQPTDKLKNSQPQIKDNFLSSNTSFGVDHYAFDDLTTNNGYHKVVHAVAISTTASNPPNNYPIIPPTPVSLTGELFSTESNDGINTDQILWFQTGGGRLTQLTSNFVPVISPNGYTFIPGGMIVQWGTITTSVNQSDVAVLFSGIGGRSYVNSNGNYGVWTNMQRSGSNNVDVVYAHSFTQNGFTYRNTSSSNQTFNWISIGK